MPNPIQVLTLAELQAALQAWNPLRKINEVHVHCTDRPRHADWLGKPSVEAMRKYHMSIHMSDIAQHLTVAPDGSLWTGRPFDAMPASVRHHNGTFAAGPFMIEMVGLFEKGIDKFANPQKAAAQGVVCAVLRKFGLDEKAVRFHREFPNTGKTCPGMDLDPKTFRGEIKKLLASSAMPAAAAAMPKSLAGRPALDREALFGRGAEENSQFTGVPEDKAALQDQVDLAGLIARGIVEVEGAAGRAINEKYRPLMPHVVNTSQGRLSTRGDMETSEASLDILIQRHLTAAFEGPDARCKHLLFFAHGGLNSEEGALDYAAAMAPWWMERGVYPIYFVWESSLFQAIWEKPRALARTTVPRGDFGDKIIEGATQKLARTVWRRMKANARRCSAAEIEPGVVGGIRVFWNKLSVWLKKQESAGKEISLHAIGHSTGPILLSTFVPLMLNDRFELTSLTYLAPAIRIDDFVRDVQPLIHTKAAAGIRRLRVYTMADDAERDDNVARIYRKSLLYYVREACEDDTGGRILGLERDLNADPAMRALFGLPVAHGEVRPGAGQGNPLARIEFAQATEAFPQNERTRATAHGCFDNEQATMETVLQSILQGDVPPGLQVEFPWSGNSQCGGDSRDFEDEDWTAALAASCGCCGQAPGAGTSAVPADDFDPPPPPPPVSPAGGSSGSVSPERTGSGAGVGSGSRRRLALCVGINDYPRQPLAGCVRDSERWAEALKGEGFEIRELRDKQATRSSLMSGLRKLIADGRAGDQLVFQFSGHGSQVEDLSGDESDPFDEVVVPVDFDSGALWLDDEIYQLCQDLRPAATLTFLMDCCHSGTNTRVAPPPISRGSSARPRLLTLRDDEVRAFKERRKTTRQVPPVSERTPLPGVVSFAACRDREVAWEENGQGVFSRHALAVFADLLRNGASNREFHEAVVRQFGSDKRQLPLFLKPATGLAEAKFLGGRREG